MERWKEPQSPARSHIPAYQHSLVPPSSPTSRPRDRRHRQRHLLAAPGILLRDFGVAATDLLTQELVVENIPARGLRRRLLQRHDEPREHDPGADRAALPQRRRA